MDSGRSQGDDQASPSQPSSYSMKKVSKSAVGESSTVIIVEHFHTSGTPDSNSAVTWRLQGYLQRVIQRARRLAIGDAARLANNDNTLGRLTLDQVWTPLRISSGLPQEELLELSREL